MEGKRYEFLTEKEEMWARMLMEVLKDNGVPYAAEPVYGAALVLRGGVKERLRIYVPAGSMEKASDLVDELFSGEGIATTYD